MHDAGEMKSPSVLRWLAALSLALHAACAAPRLNATEGEQPQRAPMVVRASVLAGEQLQLDFKPVPLRPAMEVLPVEDAHALLADFLECVETPSQLSVLPAMATSSRAIAPWEARLRAEFFARYGSGLLPLPDSVERSPLFMALRMSTHYMGPGIRDAARELFRSPIFLASVTLSILVYFSAWVLPEPLFSKAFAATLTARLALAVGLLELRNIALALLQFYREAQAARTLKELDAVAERFGRALGGTALRVLVMAASFGVAKALPAVPPGGLGPMLSPPRFALPGGGSVPFASTAHVVTDGTIVLTGAALGTAGSAAGSVCTDGSEKKDGFQWHHLATDKNDLSSARGGPWTPLFERLFAKAGVSMDDPVNRVYLSGHRGPHPEEYHREIYQRLEAALSGRRAALECKSRLVDELRKIRSEVCTPGSLLHRLLTRS